MQKTSEEVGMVLGWISAISYLSSRTPQIMKNHQRRSVEGLSPTLFILAVCGNSTYATSILMKSTDSDFIMRELPWLFGSLGVLCFDFTILLQFVFFRREQRLRAQTTSIVPISLPASPTYQSISNDGNVNI